MFDAGYALLIRQEYTAVWFPSLSRSNFPVSLGPRERQPLARTRRRSLPGGVSSVGSFSRGGCL